MINSLDFVRGGLSLANKFHESICELYDITFSEEPFVWSGEDMSLDHRKMLTEIRNSPTFSIVVAASSSDLIGFIYGHTLPMGHGWWRDISPPPSRAFTKEWEGRTFALIDLAVSSAWRGNGIGKKLLECILSDRPEERAVLSVQPTATRAQQIYAHLGWRKIGRKGPIREVVPPFWDIYTHDLAAQG